MPSTGHPRPEPNPPRPHCVLVAGPDAAIRKLLRTVLDVGGFDVVEAGSELDLVGRLATGRLPDVLVLDIHLPHFAGGEALAYVRSEPRFRGVPVVVLTSFSDVTEQLRLQRRGATAVVTKPFGSQRLLETIRRLIPQKN